MSALARTPNLRNSSAQLINLANSPLVGSGSTVGIFPKITRPVEPSSEIHSPCLRTRPSTFILLFFSSTWMAPQPETQHLPIPRVTTAAWLVMPPREVRMPAAASIP